MPDFNKVILAGYIGNDPHLKTTSRGKPYVRLSLATHTFYEGQEKKTNWHKVMVFGTQAQLCSAYLRKGSPIMLEGSLDSHTYSEDTDGKTGEPRLRTSVQVIAQRVQFLGGRAGAEVVAESQADCKMEEDINSLAS